MLNILFRKMLMSRKFMTMAVTMILKAALPLAGQWGLDASWLEESLNEALPLVIAWVLGQSAVDTAKELKAPGA